MGLMISKSLIDVGVVLDNGAAEGWRGERGAELEVGLSIGCTAAECRRLERREGSRDRIFGDMGGVIRSFGSIKFWDFWVVIVKGPSSRLMGGGLSFGDDGATIGAASARGEEIEDGVDERGCII